MAELAGVMVGNYFLLECLTREGMVETYRARPTTLRDSQDLWGHPCRLSEIHNSAWDRSMEMSGCEYAAHLPYRDRDSPTARTQYPEFHTR